MRVRKLWMIVMLLLCFGGRAQTQDVNDLAPGPKFSAGLWTEGDTLDLTVGLEWPDGIGFAALLSWYEEAPGQLWGAGAVASYQVKPEVQIPLGDLIPGNPFGLPEMFTAQIELLTKITVINLKDDPQIMGGPGIGAAIGPIAVRYWYRIIEGAVGPLNYADGAVVVLGLKNPIRF